MTAKFNRTTAVRVFIIYVLFCSGSHLKGDEASAKAKLAEHGLRVTSTGLIHADDLEFTKAMGEVPRLKRKLTLAQKSLGAADLQQKQRDDAIRRLREQNVGLSKQLANVGNADVTLHNRLVGALNANIGEMQLLEESRKTFDKQMDEVRREANSAREAYVGRVLELRPLADKVALRYKDLAENSDVKSALAEFNTAANKSFEIEPSRTFQSSVKRLESLEKSIVSEKVPLRREGNSYFASVVINSKHAHEMVVDTGASLLLLPHRMAVESGVEFSDSDPKIMLSIADGSRINGRLTKLPSVRVGQFTATDVECAVLGPEATDAPALLGMSFLGKFKFELNAQSSQLSLMRVDGDEPNSRNTKKPAAGSAIPSRKSSSSSKKQNDAPPPEPRP
ncbi:MAG: TIGR02281 family clan AA aspartic protease [Planctomycetaceae bacterium]